MPSLKVEILPALQDNYIFVVINEKTQEALIIDPPVSTPLKIFLKKGRFKVRGILLTHHHNDHIGGALELKREFNIPIIAPEKNKKEIPFADIFVQEQSDFQLSSFTFSILELPGHTLGHVAYYFTKQHLLFSGDVLFGLGCGRLFEGTYQQMFDTLQLIKKLPRNTHIYCSHEYTERNLQFVKMLMSNLTENKLMEHDKLIHYEENLMNLRNQNLPSVPLSLVTELESNPFLIAPDVNEFTHFRDLRNNF